MAFPDGVAEQNDSISSVQNFQNEVSKLTEGYLKSDFLKEVKSTFKTKHDYDLINLLKGLWFYFAICELSSRTAHTIWAYEYGDITLGEIIEGKIWLIQNWEKEILYKQFNEFIKRTVGVRKLRDMYGVESSFDSIAVGGWEWLLSLHNAEKVEIFRKLINSKILSKEESGKYEARIKELEQERDKRTLDFAIDTVKIDPQKYQELVIRYEKIAETDSKFIRKNGDINLAEIARYIRKLCNYKINERTITQALYRFRDKKGKIGID